VQDLVLIVELSRDALLFCGVFGGFKFRFGVLLFFDGFFRAFLWIVGFFIERLFALVSGLVGFVLILFILLLKVGIDIFLGLESVHRPYNSI
jgi:hypothetical protein